MDEKKLMYFIAAVEESSFEKAAERCSVSQTAISRQLASLEKELEVPLFDRSSYRAKLTEPGRHFYEEIKRIQNSYKKAVSQIKRESGNLLTIGISGPMDMKLLPRFIISFHKKYPKIIIEIKKKTFCQLVKDLEEGRLDVIFGLENELLTIPDVKYSRILKSKLCVALYDGHPLKRKEKLSIQRLKEEEFIIFSPKFSKFHYKNFMEACKNDGFMPKISMTVDSLDEMILQVSLERGIAVISEEALSGTEPIITRGLKDSSFDSKYCMAYKTQENPMIELFFKHSSSLCE